MAIPNCLPGLKNGVNLVPQWKTWALLTHLSFWGFMAAFAETGGGVLLILGFLFRPAALLLLITMVVAAMKHLYGGDSLMDASHSIELGIVFFGMFILGPGKYSMDKS